MENREIRQHPLGIPVPGDVLLFQSLQDLKTKRVPVDQFMPSPITQNFEWTSQKATAGDYDIDSIVTWNGNLYQSEVNNNVSVPGVNADWTLLTRATSGFVLWSAGTYIEDDVFTLYQILDAVYIFVLSSATRPYVSSNFLAELAAGDWELVGRSQLVVVDTTLVSDQITIDFRHLQNLMFRGSADIGEAKTWIFSNPVEGQRNTIRFVVTGDYPQQLPANVYLANTYNAEWDSVAKIWKAAGPGEHEIEIISYHNNKYNAIIHGPF